MKRLDFIKKIGLAGVGLPLLSSFGLPKECLFVEDQKEREKFDFNLYEEYKKANSFYVKKNGNIVTHIQESIFMEEDFSERKIYDTKELVNEYPFYTISKRFYEDGYIEFQKKIVGDYVLIDESFYWDKQGKLTIIDENKKFGKIRIDYIMKIVEKLGYIDLRTGAGWYNLNDEYSIFNYELDFLDNEYGKYWIIIDPKNERFDHKKHKFPEYEYGDPAMYISKRWFVDGETGQVYTEEEFKNRIKSQKTTRTFQAKPTPKKSGKPLNKTHGEKYQAKSRIRRTFGSGCLDK
ncbi:hypothetical protein [Capnocytophaga gingivalis]|uniref:hypothetical protein n=1 Tax=Capnocytophaga gingivalis TaxID=1017 RepID=UPI0028EED8C6|nr:hypothetical protein [Capnocytophaga gingivalis]